MTKQEYLKIVRKQIHYIFDRNKIVEELNQHFEDSICDLLEEGLSYEEAEHQAVSQMGNPIEIGKLLNREHHPLIGYLCSASKFLMLLLLIPFLCIMIYSIGFSVIEQITDYTRYSDEKIAELNLDIDIPSHKIHLDILGQSDYGGYYYITYYARPKFGYSRARQQSSLFNIEDYEGNILGGYSSSQFLFWSSGAKQFDWPTDDIIYIRFRDGTEIRLDLKEYCDEKVQKISYS